MGQSRALLRAGRRGASGASRSAFPNVEFDVPVGTAQGNMRLLSADHGDARRAQTTAMVPWRA